MENMRHFLSSFDPAEPHYLGLRFHNAYLALTYLTGGPGYILSRATIRLVGSALLDSDNSSSSLPWNNGYDGHDDDVQLGRIFKLQTNKLRVLQGVCRYNLNESI